MPLSYYDEIRNPEITENEKQELLLRASKRTKLLFLQA